jgi:phosphoribosyl 1,2-cyclic phosphodiesterase
VRVTVLGSGSDGNATLVEAGDVRILVDAGFSGRDLERRLQAVDVDPSTLTGILITHDHGDHTRGMGIMARRFGVPLHLTEITHDTCRKLLTGGEEIRHYRSAEPFQLGPLIIEPFLTVHDAADPVAITIREATSGLKLGIATDLGRPTATVRHALAGCDLLVLEANHDEAMLWNGPYPWSVKQRIASSHGHLSNRAAAELALELFHPGIGAVILAHLSDSSNAPDLAAEVVGLTLEEKGYAGELLVARQDEPLEPIEVSELASERARRESPANAQLSLL